MSINRIFFQMDGGFVNRWVHPAKQIWIAAQIIVSKGAVVDVRVTKVVKWDRDSMGPEDVVQNIIVNTMDNHEAPSVNRRFKLMF